MFCWIWSDVGYDRGKYLLSVGILVGVVLFVFGGVLYFVLVLFLFYLAKWFVLMISLFVFGY